MLRHPLTLLTREVQPLTLRPGATWLLAQDLHRPFADLDHGALAEMAARKVVSAEFAEYADTLRLIEPNVARLLAVARESGLGVVYSCLGYARGEEPSPFQRATGWCWRLDGPEGGFAAALQPAPGEPVFAKPGWGALANPAFARFLDEREVENLLVMGTMFNFGIRQTCYELMDRGFGSLVVSDAVAPLTHAAQGHVAGNLAHGLVKLRSTAEVIDLLAVMRREGTVLV
ncbi:MAG: cysteine hydrolase family protein [Thermomicrobiales bacterium]